MKNQLYIVFTAALFFFVGSVYAATPPNSPTPIAPPHNNGWVESGAIPPGDITFLWQDNGDAENNPLWFYFYLIKWNEGTRKWQVHTTTYTSAQGVTTITRTLNEGYYAWQVAAIDSSQSSDPWYAWADRDGNNVVDVLDWSYLFVKQTTPGGGSSGGPEFFISPLGSDANPGSVSQPWKTFSYAISQLDPGEILTLQTTLTIGSDVQTTATYTPAVTGLPDIKCGVNAKHGTQSSPITIRAKVERKALLLSDGTKSAFSMENCTSWNVEGFRGESVDNAAGTGLSIPVFSFDKTVNLNIKRLLALNPNRYTNSSAIRIADARNMLLEESEAYWFHRWGIEVYGGDAVTLRRNYTNSRDYTDISGGWQSLETSTGDFGSGGYPVAGTKHLLVENTIDENSNTGVNGGINVNDGVFSKFLGAISFNNNGNGMLIHTTKNTDTSYNTFYENVLSINNGGNGFFNRAGANTIVNNATFYSNNADGVRGDKFPDVAQVNTFLKNVLSFENERWGFNITGQNSWSVEYSNAADNATGDYNSPGLISDTSGNVRFSTSTPPTKMGMGQGECVVFIPSASNMKGKGKDGADIGANILYAYENGILNTEKKLWDTAVDSGRFIGCGAIISSVNNLIGSSCFDVHKRLNVNMNGCTLPY